MVLIFLILGDDDMFWFLFMVVDVVVVWFCVNDYVYFYCYFKVSGVGYLVFLGECMFVILVIGCVGFSYFLFLEIVICMGGIFCVNFYGVCEVYFEKIVFFKEYMLVWE